MASRKPNGYWTKWENVERELRKIVKQEGDLPSQHKLAEMGYNSLAAAIPQYHGGYHVVRKRLGLDQVRNPNGYWQDRANVIQETQIFLNKHPEFKTLPPQTMLSQLGYSMLASAISIYHGGLVDFRNSMYLPEGKERVTKNNWKDFEFAKKQALEVMMKLKVDNLPPEDILRQHGFGSLASAITKYHEGMQEFRERLGIQKIHFKPNTWKSLDFTLAYAENWLRQHTEYDNLPSGNILCEKGESGLQNAISVYHGGFHKFRELLAKRLSLPTEEERLEELVRRYVRQ